MSQLIGSTVGRYKILSALGAGGMGVVYEAEDAELGRRVAIKFISDDAVSDSAAVARFMREARAVSSLNHPHICIVHDIGVHDSRPFLVMERLQGTTFQYAIEKKPFPLERTVALAVQIADALETAHRAGIVHRDLKPSNLFLTDRNEAKILDFGLAKLTSSPNPSAHDAETAPLAHATAEGTTLGTVAYMSPEQARAESVDARTDLFSLGVVLYEMSTGRLPFPGPSTAEFLAGILSADPVPPTRLNPDVPPSLERVILKSLEKDPALRYQNAADLRADLMRLIRDTQATAPALVQPVRAVPRRAIATGLVVGLMAVAGGWYWLAQSPSTEPGVELPAAEKRIAVLPFENIGAPEDRYFTDGITDELRSKLAELPGLAVIARASSNSYRGTSTSPRDVAQDLGVQFLVTATVRWQKSGDLSRIRLTPELVEIVGTDAPTTRWQQTFDAELADVFDVQSRIATQVAQALGVALETSQTHRLQAQATSNLSAYDAYLRGREIFDRGFNIPTQQDAAAKFEQAVAIDPEFAQAWARLSLARSMLHANGLPSPELRESALAAAEKAMALAPRLAETHFALGVYHRAVDLDRDQAVDVFRSGLEFAPGNADLLRNLGYAEAERGRLEESLSAMRRAASLDPRSWANQLSLSDTLTLLHRPREAREAADRGLALNPVQVDLIRHKVHTYLQEGDLTGARGVVAAVPKEVEPTVLVADFAYYNNAWVLTAQQRDLLLRLTPAAFGNDRSGWAYALATEYWLRGNKVEAATYAEQARAGYAEQLVKSPDDANVHSQLGLMLAILGRRELAAQNGERAVELAPIDKFTDLGGAALKHLAFLYARIGRPEPAIDALERLLKAPYRTTPGWLRVDPNFDPLRGHPRFDKLVQRPD